MTARALISRWHDNPELGVDAAVRLISGEGFNGFDGFGSVDGRLDLRGLSMPPVEVVKRIQVGRMEFDLLEGILKVKNQSWDSLDLSHSILPHVWFTDSRIHNCVLDRGDLRDWRFWRGTITESRFIAADLRGALIGNDGNRWTDVDFSKANFAGAFFVNGVFERCNFSHAKLNKQWFYACALRDVIFAGRIYDLMFDNRVFDERMVAGPLERLDFSDATLEYLGFLGCNFADVIWPVNAGITVFSNYTRVYGKQMKSLEGQTDDRSAAARRIASRALEGPGHDGADGYFNKNDKKIAFDAETAEFLEQFLWRTIDEVGEVRVNP